jgi:hypothetical protein
MEKMPIPVPKTLVTIPGTFEGCEYWRYKDQLLLANQGDGKIYAVSVHAPAAPTVLGTGYSTPSDIVLSADGLHAYIAERGGGNLLRVPLSNLNRTAATVIASVGSGIAQQIGMDEAHGFAYLVGRRTTTNELLRINLLTGTISVVDSNPGLNPKGVLASSDGAYVYVSNSDANNIVRYDLAANTKKVIATGLNYPVYMVWLDTTEKVIMLVQRGPPGKVMRVDLTTATPSVSEVAGPTADNPCSLAVCSPDYICISTFRTVQGVTLTPYLATGPVLLGIGFVPADTVHIPKGYADTTMDPSYFFQVRDAPFGGTLPLMINHDGIRAAGANFYKILAGPAGSSETVTQAYSDYCWNAALNRFELKTVIPTNGLYPVHAAGEIWLNYWLGMLLSTSDQPNGLITIRIGLYKNANTEIGKTTDPGRSVTLMIDNSLPSAVLHQINHCLQITPTVTTKPVPACGIVDSGLPCFTFTITANQAQKHLAGWSLVAYWGDNKSRTVAYDNYSSHLSPSRLWGGIEVPTQVPPPPASRPPAPYWNATVPGDPTSTRCAYLFVVYAWDRVTNGWWIIHGTASYHKSITIMV